MRAEADLYSILGVHRTASQDEIKHAYRKLARQCHPDLHGNCEEMEEQFKQVSMAYEILSDPSKRAQYDQFGITGGPGGNGSFGSVADIFDFFFSGGFGGFSQSHRTQRDPAYADGEDIVENVPLELKDALTDSTLNIKIRRFESCEKCSGSRAEPGTFPSTCTNCSGRGILSQARQTLLGLFSTTLPCPNCRGTGKLIETPCRACRGNGVVAQDRALDVTIPAGITDGTVLRLGGRGHAGTGGGRNGDILLCIRVKPHPVFTVEGPDLFAELPLTYPELALGVELLVEHPSGSQLKVKVPPRTQPGELLTLRSQGMPRVSGKGSGDVHLLVKLDIPPKQSREEEKLLLALLDLNGKRAQSKNKLRPLRKLRGS